MKTMLNEKAVAKEPKSDNDYEAESAADTIMRAEAHKANPDLMKRVHAHLHKKKKAISSVMGLKDAYAKKVKEKDDTVKGVDPTEPDADDMK